MPRKKLPIDKKRQVLHDAGYKCGNPICRTIITLDIHHIVPISDEGNDNPDNLLALCPNCHSLYHKNIITSESIRAWKLILISLNHAMDRKALEILLTLSKFDFLYISGDGILQCSSLISAGYVKASLESMSSIGPTSTTATYTIRLNERGKLLVSAWESGDQEKVVNGIGLNNGSSK